MTLIDGVRLDGIPCQAWVEIYQDEDQFGKSYREFEIHQMLDRKGSRAKWLEAKLEGNALEDLEQQIENKLDDMAQLWEEDRAECRYESMIDECLMRR